MKANMGRDETLVLLGDRFQHALVEAVDQARTDLAEFREFRSGWFVDFSQRFVSNFIHERIWAELVVRLRAVPEATIVDTEPHREIGWRNKAKVRVKRHRFNDRVASYPTRGARRYFGPSLPHEDLIVTNLAVGYRWDEEASAVGPAVISYRESLDAPASWAAVLERDILQNTIRIEPMSGEQTALLDLSSLIDEQDTGTET